MAARNNAWPHREDLTRILSLLDSPIEQSEWGIWKIVGALNSGGFHLIVSASLDRTLESLGVIRGQVIGRKCLNDDARYDTNTTALLTNIVRRNVFRTSSRMIPNWHCDNVICCKKTYENVSDKSNYLPRFLLRDPQFFPLTI